MSHIFTMILHYLIDVISKLHIKLSCKQLGFFCEYKAVNSLQSIRCNSNIDSQPFLSKYTSKLRLSLDLCNVNGAFSFPNQKKIVDEVKWQELPCPTFVVLD